MIKINLFFLIIITSIFFKNNLGLLLEITGGINGVILMLIFPSLLLIKSRQKIDNKFAKKINPH